tara:strand:- start:960 stop:2585 length:1626 start_codon:yes stop_codon:yes gene_type:complete
MFRASVIIFFIINFSFSQDWVVDINKKYSPAVVTVLCYDFNDENIFFGSGFNIDKYGIIVTNEHVISDPRIAKVRIKFQNDGEFEVRGVLYENKLKDFAILKIDGFDLPIVELGNSNDVSIGEEVVAIGSPLFTELYGTITKGIISQRRNVEGTKIFQMTANINEGNSGGPLLNKKGEVIAINQAGSATQNIFFSVEINYVRGALPSAKEIVRKFSPQSVIAYNSKIEIPQKTTAPKKTTAIKKKEVSKMVVKTIALCKNIEKRQPIGSNILFENSVDSLFCFTKIQNKGEKAEVRHVWYYNDKPTTIVRYNVKTSFAYNSWTKKAILPEQVGEWYVEIQTKDGELLARKYFYVANPEKVEEYKILEQFKRITNKEHDGNVKSAYKPAIAKINGPKNKVLDAVKKTMMMGAIESWMNKNPNGTASDFQKAPSNLFNEIKNNNVIAEYLIRNKANYNSFHLDDLFILDQIFFNNPIKDYDFSSIKKLTYDLTELLNDSNDDEKFVAAIEEINLIKQNYNFILHFYNMGILDEQRPLYFYPLK